MNDSSPKRAILLVGHGSAHTGEEDETLAGVAAIVRSLLREGTIVEYAFIAPFSPSFSEAFKRCVCAGAREVTVVPYFLSCGKHVTEDIPRLLESSMSRYPHITCRIALPLGTHRKLAEVIMERVEEAKPVEAGSQFHKRQDATERISNEIQTEESL